MGEVLYVKNYKLGIIFLLSTLILSSCTQNEALQNITLEAGNLQLLDVLCQHEGIQRGDPKHIIEVINDDGWIPFIAGESYNVTYETGAAETGKTEEKTISVTIIDTTEPKIVKKKPESAHADILVYYA